MLGEAEERAVIEVLRSGQLSLGPKLVEFERRFAEMLGVPHARAVSSGTAGLHLALRAAGVEEGDEVITSSFSFVASANTILYERARPVFAEIDPITLNLDPAVAEAAITPRTKAILPVHIFGYPADMPAFERLAEKHGLALVEDACEALGAVHADGLPVGGRGHPSVFAFYANKQLTTGEGGMVALGDAAMSERIDSERNQGRAGGMGWLDHDKLGFNYRLSELACAMGIVQLERLAELLAKRRQVAEAYRQALVDIEGLVLPCEDLGGDVRGWFVFVVQLPAHLKRDEIIHRLAEDGIQSKPYLPAIHLMSFYREGLGGAPGDLPVTERIAESSIALPFFPEMTEVQVARVAGRLARLLDT
ncbi:MAG TPA: DegT/DnrJ/EryC1/StrS family aminotransferase [Solirubrobacteraceae bacterium]|nr:DegT/DnrJ/EryC1/StrS family aminotransferase [Solirubrobacteraceae bacterium]